MLPFIHSYQIEPFTRRNILPIRATRATRNNVGLTKKFAIISFNVCPRKNKKQKQIIFLIKMNKKTAYQELMQLQ
jgi:hypothetical protein